MDLIERNRIQLELELVCSQIRNAEAQNRNYRMQIIENEKFLKEYRARRDEIMRMNRDSAGGEA